MPLAGPGGNPVSDTPDGDDDNGGAPDSGAGFTSPDEVSGGGGYDGDAGGGVNEPAPDPEPQEPAPDNTTGVGGDMGDPVTSPQNQPDDQDTTAPPDSTTGLGGSHGDPVPNEENRPSDPEETQETGTQRGRGYWPGTDGDTIEVDDDGDLVDIDPDNDGPTGNGGGGPMIPPDWQPEIEVPQPEVELPNIEVPQAPGPDLSGLTTWAKVFVVGALSIGAVWVLRPFAQAFAEVTGE